jgi:hypothetical protein
MKNYPKILKISHLACLFFLLLSFSSCDDDINLSPQNIAEQFVTALKNRDVKIITRLLPERENGEVFSDIMNMNLEEYENKLHSFQKELDHDFLQMVDQYEINYQTAQIKDFDYARLNTKDHIEAGFAKFNLESISKKNIKIRLIVLKKNNLWYLIGYQFTMPEQDENRQHLNI